MSETINMSTNAVTGIPNAEANADPEMTAEEVKRLLKETPRGDEDAFDKYIKEKFALRGHGVVNELATEEKIYYVWDKDFRHVYRVTNTSDYDAVFEPKDVTNTLSSICAKENAPYEGELFSVRVEEKNLWDKICGFFGHKTDHVKKIERAEQLNATRSKALAKTLALTQFDKETDDIKLSDNEKAALALRGGPLLDYLKTGTVPSGPQETDLPKTVVGQPQKNNSSKEPQQSAEEMKVGIALDYVESFSESMSGDGDAIIDFIRTCSDIEEGKKLIDLIVQYDMYARKEDADPRVVKENSSKIKALCKKANQAGNDAVDNKDTVYNGRTVTGGEKAIIDVLKTSLNTDPTQPKPQPQPQSQIQPQYTAVNE